MKKTILIVSLIGCIAFIVIGKINWDKKVEVTTAKAYESLGIQRDVPNGKTEIVEDKADSDERNKTVSSDNRTEKRVKETTQGENVEEVNSDQPEIKSLLDIKRSYYSQFGQLENTQKQNANTIVASAIIDLEKVRNGEMTLGELQGKYHQEAQRLEAQTDEQFNQTYEKLKADLSEYNYDPNEAEEFRIAYDQKKQSYRNEIIRQISKLN